MCAVQEYGHHPPVRIDSEHSLRGDSLFMGHGGVGGLRAFHVHWWKSFDQFWPKFSPKKLINKRIGDLYWTSANLNTLVA